MECRARNITKLQDILSEEQLEIIVEKAAKPGAKIINYDLQSVTTGIAGLLGDYFRLTIEVQEDLSLFRIIHLFVKTLPHNNQPKLEMIRQNSFNMREASMYKLFEEMDDYEDSNPWRPKAYIYNEDVLVMSDLSMEGYKSYPTTNYFDKNHILVTATSIARFHAAYVNYETKKTTNGNKPYNILDDYSHLMNEPVFLEPEWSQAAGKLASNFLKEFSINFKNYPAHLAEKLGALILKAYHDLNYYEDTLNVIIHKDLWFNNILFRYSGDEPTNAVLLDYQSMRYAPPAFDIMLLLYFTTTRSFRERHEREVLHHYYSVFLDMLKDDTKERLNELNYNLDSFLVWCEKARSFAMLHTSACFPLIMMDSAQAQKIFNDPETFVELRDNDRSGPIIEHAKENNIYRQKLLDLFEEIIERYVLQR